MTKMVSRDEAAEGGAARSPRPRAPRSTSVSGLRQPQPIELPRSYFARFFGASPLSVEGQQWFSDALGDMAVGALLARLGPDWRVLHAVPTGDGEAEQPDIDHVVIGPPGVFTITARNHSGQDVWVDARTVEVAGSRYPHIRDSEHGLGRAERLLAGALGESVVVTGLLVIVDPRSLAIHEMPRDLQVLSSGDLLDWLLKRPPLLGPDEVPRIASIAESADTWWRDHGLVGRAAPESPDFQLLRQKVDRARTLRELWVGTFTIVVVVSAAALGCMAVLNLLPTAAR